MQIQQKSIKKNFLYNALLKVSSIIFPFITFPYVSRVLSPEGIGKVDFSLSIVQYFILLAQVGIPAYAIRECARYRDEREKLTRTVQEILMINIFMVFISYILFILTIFFLESLRPYRVLLLIAGFNILSVSMGIEWFYQAIEEYRYIALRSIFIKLLSLVLIFTLIKDENDYIIYGLITVLSNSAGYIYNFIYARKYIGLFKKFRQYELVKHIKPISVLFAMSISVSIYMNLDMVMLGFMSGDKAVGLFSTANKIIIILLALVTSMGSVLLPRMSYYVEKNESGEIKKLISKSLDFILMLSIPSAMAVFILARPIILILCGNGFAEAIPTMKIMSPIILVNAVSNLIGVQILLAYGKEKITLLSTIAGAIINFIANMLLIPLLKQDGAAIGILATEVVVAIVQVLFAYRYIKGNFSSRNIFSYIGGAILIVLARSVIDVLIKNIFLSTILTAIFCGALYFLFLYLLKNMLVHEMAGKLLNRIKEKRGRRLFYG